MVRLVIPFPYGEDCSVEETAKYKDQPQDNQCTFRGSHENFAYGISDANDGMKREPGPSTSGTSFHDSSPDKLLLL